MVKTEKEIIEMYTKLENSFVILNEKSEEFGIAEGGILPISENIYTELKQANEILYEFNLFKRKTQEVKLNYQSILDSENEWTSVLTDNKGDSSTLFQEQIFIDVNRRVSNFIVSLKSLVDDLLIKHKLPSIFGNDAVEHFKKKVSSWYDTKLSYKFFIRLRDFAVHYDLPIQIVSFSYDYDEERDSQIQVQFEIKFRKETLLNNSTFDSKLGLDLKLYNNTFPLMPFLEEIEFIFDEILKAIISISDSRYMKAVKIIENHIDQIPEKMVISFGQIKKEGTSIGPKTEIINLDTMDMIKRLSLT